MLLLVGIGVFSLMVIGVIMTVLEFREIPEEQPPVFDSVADQAQPLDTEDYTPRQDL